MVNDKMPTSCRMAGACRRRRCWSVGRLPESVHCVLRISRANCVTRAIKAYVVCFTHMCMREGVRKSIYNRAASKYMYMFEHVGCRIAYLAHKSRRLCPSARFLKPAMRMVYGTRLFGVPRNKPQKPPTPLFPTHTKTNQYNIPLFCSSVVA